MIKGRMSGRGLGGLGSFGSLSGRMNKGGEEVGALEGLEGER